STSTILGKPAICGGTQRTYLVQPQFAGLAAKGEAVSPDRGNSVQYWSSSGRLSRRTLRRWRRNCLDFALARVPDRYERPAWGRSATYARPRFPAGIQSAILVRARSGLPGNSADEWILRTFFLRGGAESARGRPLRSAVATDATA